MDEAKVNTVIGKLMHAWGFLRKLNSAHAAHVQEGMDLIRDLESELLDAWERVEDLRSRT